MTHQFQAPSSNRLNFLFQISYNEMSEVLLSYNSTSHIQKMEFDAPETHKISWNSVPVCKVVCAFPYILAFTPVAIEFRYAVNGSLLQTLAMPELRLISAKVCVYINVQCNQKFVFRNLKSIYGIGFVKFSLAT